MIARVVYTGIPVFGPAELAQRLQKAPDIPTPTEDGEAILAHIGLMWTYVVAQRDPAVPELDRDIFDVGVLQMASALRQFLN
ncbi:hypothetical protein [Sandaracinobacteroides hominis]|uniref:hypothetical protein n=1 Tax=Sandaracinobacteroides hominis TaxID=2780086 RepID=UPI0018F5B554|nr:hypothetical protein [Sandaracinobacteroides hominis]